jgi:hypothetical protein
MHRFSVAHFLCALAVLLVAEPFIEEIPHGKSIEVVLIAVVLLFAVRAIGGSRRTLIWAVVLVIPAIGARVANHFWPNQVPVEGPCWPGVVFVLYVAANLLRYVLRASRVNSEVLCAGIAAYLMLGLLWAFAYILVEHHVPGSFAITVSADAGQSVTGFNALYFSFVTLSTVGYGDIIPVAPVAKLLAVMEATVGILTTTVLIARLVALYSSEQAENK